MILLRNTCGDLATLALAEGLAIIAEETLPGREASERLAPALRRLLAQAGPLQAVAVVHGPGSFTGVRVGLAAAKGLCEARAIPLLAMSRLALVSTQNPSPLNLRLTNSAFSPTIAVLDAGRGEFSCGFSHGGGVASEEILKREELLLRLPGCDVLTCEPRVHEALLPHCTLVPEPGAQTMAALAYARLAAGAWSDIASTDANYLRRTDAELLQAAQR